MKLTDENKQILKALSNISDQVYFTPEILGITDEHKVVGAYYDWKVDLKESFGVFSLSEFLNILSLYKDPFIEKDGKFIKIGEGDKMKPYTKYTCLNEGILKPINKNDFIQNILKQLDNEFCITKDELINLKKNISILKNTHIKFENNTIQTFNKKINSDSDSENQFVMELNVQDIKSKIINSSSILNIIPDSYKINLYSNVVWMEAQNYPLQYMAKLVAL